MHPPHPILKRSASQAAEAEARHPSVHFPPSPRLTRTFSAHSPSSYDRSPIVVSPNSCALPARGCPGRTYYPGSGSTAPKAHPAKTAVARGHLHPRALAAYAEDDGRDYDDEEDEDDAEAERTPTRTSPYIPLPVPPPIPNASFTSLSSSSSMVPPSLYNSSTSSFSSAFSASSFSSSAPHYPTYSFAPSPYPNTASAPPPLIPDLSSESDESDGFASPPPEPAYSGFVTGGGTKYPSYPSSYAAYPTSYYPSPTPYTVSAPYPISSPYSSPNSPYSPSPAYSTQPTVEDRKRRPRRPSPRRPASASSVYGYGVAGAPEDGYEEEDVDGSHAAAYRASLAVGTSPASPPRMSPPRSAKASRDREKDSTSSYSAASFTTPSTSPPRAKSSRSPKFSSDSSRASKSSDSSNDDPLPFKPSSREKKAKDDKCRVSALCRSLASARVGGAGRGGGFKDEGEGCLGGF